MPYIKFNEKMKFDKLLNKLGKQDISNTGQLNYILTRVILLYLKQHGAKYATVNDILGALDGCSKEFYRRFVSEYENIKAQDNGDVYDECYDWLNELVDIFKESGDDDES